MLGIDTALDRVTADGDVLLAQLQLLDPLQRPQLIVGDDTFANLTPDHHFEVVAGRLNRQDMGQRITTQLLQQFDQRCPSGSQIRLLLSDADLGPTEALLQLCELSNLTPEEQAILINGSALSGGKKMSMLSKFANI